MAKKKQTKITVLIADDETKVRLALRFWLNRQTGVQVLGEAVDATGVWDWVRIPCPEPGRRVCPDVILLDWELPGQPAADLVSDLRSHCPQSAIVALSGRTEAEIEAQAAGVDAFVRKGGPPEQLLAVLKSRPIVDITSSEMPDARDWNVICA